MSSLITKLLDGETENGLAQLEDISETMKRERIEVPSAPLKDEPAKSHTEKLAKAQWELFKVMSVNIIIIMYCEKSNLLIPYSKYS